MNAPVSEAEDAAWDDLFDTQALRCCDCPSCNHYLPADQYKPESKCVVMDAIDRIVAARVSVDRAKVEAVEALRDNWRRLAAAAMDPDTREWLTATWKSLDAALGAPSATGRGGKIAHG